MKWIECICVIDFHERLGPRINYCYPNDILNETELKTISFQSFPHSTSSELKEMKQSYCFTIRSNNDNNRFNFLDSLNLSNLYCYVHYQAILDKERQRGTKQRSIVLISILPCYNLLLRLVKTIYKYAENNHEEEKKNHNFIKETYNFIAKNWSIPQFGQMMTFPLYSSIFQQQIPYLKPCFANPKLLINGWYTSINLYHEFYDILDQLWYLWELMLTGSSMLIYATNPTNTSRIILALISLISPIIYQVDYRPYFTIYDTDYKYLLQQYQKGGITTVPNVLLGVSNPIFLEQFALYIPHILQQQKQGPDDDDAAGMITLSSKKNNSSATSVIRADKVFLHQLRFHPAQQHQLRGKHIFYGQQLIQLHILDRLVSDYALSLDDHDEHLLYVVYVDATKAFQSTSSSSYQTSKNMIKNSIIFTSKRIIHIKNGQLLSSLLFTQISHILVDEKKLQIFLYIKHSLQTQYKILSFLTLKDLSFIYQNLLDFLQLTPVKNKGHLVRNYFIILTNEFLTPFYDYLNYSFFF